MRYESSVLSLSWIPSEAVSGMPRLPFELGLVHYDDPPPDNVTDPQSLLATDRVRLVNELRAWVEVEADRIVDCGYSGGGHLNISTVRLPGKRIAFAAVPLPDLQHEPDYHDDRVTFVQTAGGRTALPAPRRVSRKPFVQLLAPLAWTTLTLTIHNNGRAYGGCVGASPFPRHWLYESSGQLVSKTGAIDFDSWYRLAFGQNTPWGNTESPAFVTQVETALERQSSLRIMRGGKRPGMKRLHPGETLVEQGATGDTIFLLLDGVLDVEVDGERIAEIGPGAIVGERAFLEGGRRTSTMRALTPCRIAVASPDDLDPAVLAEISQTHHREDEL